MYGLKIYTLRNLTQGQKKPVSLGMMMNPKTTESTGQIKTKCQSNATYMQIKM